MPRAPRLALFSCCLVALLCGLSAAARADNKKAAKKHAPAPVTKKAEEAPLPDLSATRRAAPEPPQQSQEVMSTRGPTRLDFDDRTVQGQGSKVGAVYLYDRKNLPLRSMVRKRENFRDQIGSDEVSGPVVE